KKLADLGSPSIDQLVYAEFIASGALDRHLRRMRLLYRGRRDALARMLTTATRWTIGGIAAGLNLVATLSSEAEESRVVTAARAQVVVLHSMSEYRWERARPMKHALVFGYGQFTEQEIETGLRRAF